MNYLIEDISISIDDVNKSDRSYKWLWDNSQRIRMQFRDIIEEFYRKYTTSPTKVYRYVISPEWAEASNNSRMRFIIIKLENDFIFIPLKVVDPICHERYMTISLEPISYLGISDNEIRALHSLSEFNCVKYIAVPEEIEKDEADNNYYNLLDDFKEMDRSTWRSKRGVNKLSNLIDIYTNAEEIPGIEDMILDVNKLWDEIKLGIDKKFKLSKKTDFNLAKLAIKNDSIFLYGFFYHGKLIGYSIASIIIDKYVSLLATKQITNNYNILSTYIDEDTEELKKVHKHLSSFMQYSIHKNLLKERGFMGVFNYGDVKVKGLRDFKNDYYKHKFSYNKYSIKDYLSRRLENG